MKMTKYTHSCIRLENEGRTLVLDPGNFAAEGEHATALEGADYLFVTHAHPDHFDGPSVLPLIAERAESQTPLKIWAPEAVAQTIKEAVPAAEVTVVSSDSEFSIPGFEVKTYGGQHALIHPLIQIAPEGTGMHTVEFAHCADTPAAVDAALDAAFGLASIALDFLVDNELAQAVRADFEASGGAVDVEGYFSGM